MTRASRTTSTGRRLVAVPSGPCPLPADIVIDLLRALVAAPAEEPEPTEAEAASTLREATGHRQRPAVPSWDRNDAIKAIRTGLRRRSDRAWSVTGGRGTSWGWITITAPPARRDEYGRMTDDDRAHLAALLGKGAVDAQGECVPAGSDYRAEYVARAEGQTPEVHGTPYWD